MVSKSKTMCKSCNIELFDVYMPKHLKTKRHLKKHKGTEHTNIMIDHICTNCNRIHTINEIKLIKSGTYIYFEGCWVCWYYIKDLK